MLNRHTLRIKALQTLYAIRQAENANYQLALDVLRADFAPDLNAMIRPDAQRLEGLRQLATLTFEELAGQKTSDEDVPLEARRAAAVAFAGYREANRADRQRLLKAALAEPSRIYDHYLLVLLLLLELADEATLADERRQSTDPEVLRTAPFGRNATLTALRGLAPLQTEAIRRNLAWTDDDRRSRIRPFFRETLRTDPAFTAYCQRSTHSPEEDHTLALHVLKALIFRGDTWQEYFEKRDLYWDENRDIVRSLSLKTLRSAEAAEPMALQPLSPGGEDDLQFFEDLLRAALDHAADFEALVTSQVQNWELDRLALTDRLLLTLALAELMHFPGIPVKVTLNEYIDIAKDYSTPKSGQFLNGILDVLSTKLKENGTLRKSGRGLIDNR